MNSYNYPKSTRLVDFTQSIPEFIWVIPHDLTSAPKVYVYEDNITIEGNKSHIQLSEDDYVVTIAVDQVKIEFAEKKTGRVQLIPTQASIRSSKKIKPSDNIQVTTNSILTIAIPILIPHTDNTISLSVTDIYSTTSHTIQMNPHSYNGVLSLYNTPWKNSRTVSFDSASYRVYSANLYSVFSSKTSQSSIMITDLPEYSTILLSTPPYSDASDTSTNVLLGIDVVNIQGVLMDQELLVDSNDVLRYPHNPITIQKI